MMIDLRQLFEVEGTEVAIDHDLDLSDLELGAARPFTEPVHLSGSVRNHAGIVSLSYTAAAVMHTQCDRCLAPIHRPVVYAFEHALARRLQDDSNDEFIVVPDGMLDLDDLAASDILLELPSKVLCKEDCKGLCPICGVNRNEQSCHCTEKRVDPRLEVLSRLLQNDD